MSRRGLNGKTLILKVCDSVIKRVFDTPPDEKPDRARSSVVGRDVYEAYLGLKTSSPELTQREIADRLGLNLTQIKNALRRQRKARGVRPLKRGQYRDWRDDD